MLARVLPNIRAQLSDPRADLPSHRAIGIKLRSYSRRGPQCLRASLVVLLALLSGGVVHARNTTVFCIGDSLTAGSSLEPALTYPALLERRLHESYFGDVVVVNAGRGGASSAHGPILVKPLRIRPRDILVLELGSNDRTSGLSLDETRHNLSQLIEWARSKRQARVLLVAAVNRPGKNPEYFQALAAIYRELAREHDVRLIPDILEGVGTNLEYLMSDGLHPNARGHAIIADTVYRHLVPILRAPAQPAWQRRLIERTRDGNRR